MFRWVFWKFGSEVSEATGGPAHYPLSVFHKARKGERLVCAPCSVTAGKGRSASRSAGMLAGRLAGWTDEPGTLPLGSVGTRRGRDVMCVVGSSLPESANMVGIRHARSEMTVGPAIDLSHSGPFVTSDSRDIRDKAACQDGALSLACLRPQIPRKQRLETARPYCAHSTVVNKGGSPSGLTRLDKRHMMEPECARSVSVRSHGNETNVGGWPRIAYDAPPQAPAVLEWARCDGPGPDHGRSRPAQPALG